MGLFSPFRTIRRIALAMAVMFAGGYAVQRMNEDHAPLDPHPSALHGRSGGVFGQVADADGAQAAVVSRSIDGDTIEVFVLSAGPLPSDESVTVRLIGIDTPETRKPGAPVECGGPAASEFTADLLAPGTKVALVPDVETTDPYGRALRYVYTRDRLANVAIARAGYAQDLLIEPNDAHITRIRHAVDAARAAGRGMWVTCQDPFAPAS